MKEENDITILTVIDEVLTSNDWSFFDAQELSLVAAHFLQCYKTADVDGVSTMHLRYRDATLIFAPSRCSYIDCRRSSQYHYPEKIIQYNSLLGDIMRLASCYQLAFLRI